MRMPAYGAGVMLRYRRGFFAEIHALNLNEPCFIHEQA